MADANLKEKPFNLLYRFEPQQTPIDKLYDFVVVQGRVIVVTVMLIVIVLFASRFPLDMRLADERNRAEKNLSSLKIYTRNEPGYRDIVAKTQGVNQYLNIYTDSVIADDQGLIEFSDVLTRVNEIRNEFKDKIIITDYSYNTAPDLKATVQLTGYASTFPDAESFREKLRLEKSLVEDVLINNLGSGSSDNIPKFGLTINVRRK